jgi:hypothetical protein
MQVFMTHKIYQFNTIVALQLANDSTFHVGTWGHVLVTFRGFKATINYSIIGDVQGQEQV